MWCATLAFLLGRFFQVSGIVINILYGQYIYYQSRKYWLFYHPPPVPSLWSPHSCLHAVNAQRPSLLKALAAFALFIKCFPWIQTGRETLCLKQNVFLEKASFFVLQVWHSTMNRTFILHFCFLVLSLTGTAIDLPLSILVPTLLRFSCGTAGGDSKPLTANQNTFDVDSSYLVFW